MYVHTFIIDTIPCMHVHTFIIDAIPCMHAHKAPPESSLSERVLHLPHHCDTTLIMDLREAELTELLLQDGPAYFSHCSHQMVHNESTHMI